MDANEKAMATMDLTKHPQPYFEVSPHLKPQEVTEFLQWLDYFERRKANYRNGGAPMGSYERERAI